jgi:DNA (cytosine-5)-methyltransferase 1
LAFSEIEAFPRAVLAHHYPGVPCHGDFTVLRDQPWIVDADVLVGGTPCQAFSVAGLRNSLDDARGNLSLEFVRLADAIDDVRKLADKDPAIIVWENVPGVLSVKDNAFGCFLAGLAGDVDPYVPPRGKWTNAGVVAGPQRQVAWRVLDAQYFGLAQRRRRVFVVASARDGFDPAAVLLEFEGVRRDTPPRREAGQVAPGGATGRTGERSHWDGDFPHPTLNQSAKSSGGVGASNQELFSQRGAYLAPAVVDVCPTLRAGGNSTSGDRPPGTDVDTADSLIVMSSGQANAEIRTDGGTPALTCLHEAPIVAHTLKGEGFDASEDGTGRGTPLVPVGVTIHGTDKTVRVASYTDVAGALRANTPSRIENSSSTVVQQPIPFDTTQITSPSNYSRPKEGDPCHPLAAGAHPPTVAVGVQASQSGVRLNDTAGTLDANYGPRRHNGVMVPVGGGDKPHVLAAVGFDSYNLAETGDVAQTLKSPQGGVTESIGAVLAATFQQSSMKGKGTIGYDDSGVAKPVKTQMDGQMLHQHMAVRRLTPVECERLQGFPDFYTMIPWKKKPADQCPDGPRYKALGNSMAVPVMRWIGRRIAEALR